MITKHPHTYRHIYTHVPMAYNQLGSTALHFAVDGEHEEVVELLLKANIDPDLPGKVMHEKHCTFHLLLFTMGDIFCQSCS